MLNGRNMTSSKSVIKNIHDKLISKNISCKELTEKYFKKINESNLNAYVKLSEDTAYKTAEKVDKKIASGEKISPLEGIPMTLKDNISTDGIETTCCSKMLKGYVPIYDATVWKLLKNQNAVLLGKANMDEFAMGSSCETSCFGASFNPHNLSYVPGGSSGGAAAAVCGNIAAFGLGSDTGGSIRQPAGFCGIVGLKPTYGSVSRYGLIAYASSFDQIGPITQTVEDTAMVFDAISKYDPMDSTSNPNINFDTFSHLEDDVKGVKMGVPNQYFDGIDEEVKQSIEKAVKVYKSMGIEVEYFDLPELRYSLPVYYILACAEASSNLGRFDGIRYGYQTKNYSSIDEMICKTRSEGFGKEVQRRILLGTYVLSSGYYDAYYKKAQILRGTIVEAFKKAFDKYDVLLAPTSPTTAFKLNYTSKDPVKTYLMDICTVPINIAGLPSVALPCGMDSKGLPIGMQILGKAFSEQTILNVAYQYEVFTDYSAFHRVDMGVKL
ncbi:MAG: Asp-tRNA(Asn)/Glu-tRNA(Gln) amidotransferase subunit GatA [Oscillospiraceae bacterium]|jgi:aspartyl-tRNA(Asn)/glutamyl-tRNA(Gln) amidotransferase subunit A|nr:Asp-tRNA(Asn)/Glu-tRNA(Gln) amidotransferase subunit GatA [Oscillospiraceae bacterium]